MGRRRDVRWGPRSIDLDLLLYDQEVRQSPSLVLPHPRMTQRRFVLEPAAAIAASMVHPLTGCTLRQHLDSLEEMDLDAAPRLFAAVAELRAALAPLRAPGARSAWCPPWAPCMKATSASSAPPRPSATSSWRRSTSIPANSGRRKTWRSIRARSTRTWRNWPSAAPISCWRPRDDEVYRPGHATWVEVGGVGEPLEGQFRPGHFRGVATIVLKLLKMVGPDAAYFGQKDCQQAAVIRRMAEDLNVPVEIRVCPTVREPDGLAMSSRNAYLSPAARRRARVLWKSLQLAEELVRRGQRSAEAILQQMRTVVETAGDAQIDYIALVDPETFQPIDRVERRLLAALAVRIENTRLIDNCILEPPAL